MPRPTEPPSLLLATAFENDISVQVSQSQPGARATLTVQGPLSAVLTGLGVFMEQAKGKTRQRSSKRRGKQANAAAPG